MSPDPIRRRRWIRARLGILCAILLVAAVLVVRRAWEVTVVHGPGLSALAEQQQLREIRIAPKRGTIYDRHGAELAVSVDVESVYANPRTMRSQHVDLAQASLRLASVLGVDRAAIQRRLEAVDQRGLPRYFVWIDRQVTPAEADAVRALAIPGVELTAEARRYYPNRELASHLLGFADIDGVGIEGLELSMEERLRGSARPVPALRDRRGRVVFSDQLLDERAAQGDDLYLTIDKTIQHVTERELALAVRTFEAQAGSVVVMDPRTGEILAMANYPTYDPNEPAQAPASHRRNRAITDRFEPGSTVKPFVVGAALATGVLQSEQSIDCGHGVMDIGDDRIRDTHVFDTLTPAEILTHSSNIGAARIGQMLGRASLYRSLRRFGFGEPTGLPLPGETGGILRHHSRWYELDLATISFGQGFSSTTIQLAAAMSAIANGGRLMEPRLVRRVVDAHGGVVEEGLPRVSRQVLPRPTARLVGDMLTAVTGDSGTGLEAAIDGYLVAGKTGTAQKADYVHGGYADGRFMASFVGFVPAQDPRLVIAVVIDEPMVDHYGGTVAGPVFRRIGQAALRHLGVPAETGGEILAQLERERRQRERAAREAGRAARAADSSSQSQLSNVAASERAPGAGPGAGEVVMPDLAGQTVRAALVATHRAGLGLAVDGSGISVAQDPLPGAIVPRGTTARVRFARPDPGAPAPGPPGPASPAAPSAGAPSPPSAGDEHGPLAAIDPRLGHRLGHRLPARGSP